VASDKFTKPTREFSDFLKELRRRDLYAKYVREMSRPEKFNVIEKLKLLNDDMDDMIDMSFTWAETIEGHNFWSKLCDEFSVLKRRNDNRV